MGSKAPTWADQWGSGSGNSEDDYGKSTPSSRARLGGGGGGGGGGKKMENVKAAASAGFDKAKSVTMVGARKLKTGSSMGIKWVKDKYQKKSSK